MYLQAKIERVYASSSEEKKDRDVLARVSASDKSHVAYSAGREESSGSGWPRRAVIMAYAEQLQVQQFGASPWVLVYEAIM